MYKGIVILLSVIGISALTIADVPVEKEELREIDHSIRISLGNAPELDEGEILGSPFPISGDTGGQLEVLYTRRHWTENNPNFAGIWGAGLFIAGHEGFDPTFPSDTVDIAAFGVMGQGGIAFRIGNIVVIEAQPYLGLGGANVEITGFSDGGGSYVMYGAKGGLFVALGRSIELGVEAGYQGFSSEVELDFGGPTTDLTLSGSGLHAAAVLAIKL